MTPPHVRINNKYFKNLEFLEFTKKTEFSILLFLLAYIVREIQNHHAPSGALRIYRQFYKKGLLCASYSQNDIAEYFGFIKKNGKPNGAYISKLIKNLEKMGMLRIHKTPTPMGLKNVYELGCYKGTFREEGYKEFLYFDLYFEERGKKHILEQEKESCEELIDWEKPEALTELQDQTATLHSEVIELTEKVIESFQ